MENKAHPLHGLINSLTLLSSKGYLQLGLFLSMLAMNISTLITFFTTNQAIDQSIQSIYLTNIRLTNSYTAAVQSHRVVSVVVWITLILFVVYLVSIYLKNKSFNLSRYWAITAFFAIVSGFVYLFLTSDLYKQLEVYNQLLACKTQVDVGSAIPATPECLALLNSNTTLGLFSKFAIELSSKIVPIVTIMVLMVIFSFLTFFLLVRKQQKIQYKFIKANGKMEER